MIHKTNARTVVKPKMLFIAGFGDNSSMFEPLKETSLAKLYDLVPLNLPGFGAPKPGGPTTLHSLASFVSDRAQELDAQIIVAHSIASIIASLAIQVPQCPIRTIISLEGNITEDDAYFSGTAANYDDSVSFRAEFLLRLEEMAKSSPIVDRYRQAVAKADMDALWELGCDARRYSENCVPGEALAQAPNVRYLYNPENCPNSTLEWLAVNPMKRLVLDDATHWKSVDQPQLLADKIFEALD